MTDANATVGALKPCPFCGSPGKMIHPMGHWQGTEGGTRPAYGPDGSRIVCTKDDCSGSGWVFYGEDQDARAFEQWNTRTSPLSSAPEREAIARIIDPAAWAYRDECLARHKSPDWRTFHPVEHIAAGMRDGFPEQAAQYVTASLTKADKILALQSPQPNEGQIPAGMVAWAGGDSAPDDWDGGQVMTRDGSIYLHDNTSVNRWKHGTARTSYFPLRPDLDIVAYTPKASPQPNDAGLREALEPFAKYADGVGHFTGPSTPFYFSFSSSVVGDREITEEDFRRARAALASTSLGDGA